MTAFPLAPTDITLDREADGIALVTIGRPAKKNALSLAMWSRMAELFRELAQDPDLRAVILTGAGGVFSAGADIGEFPAVRSTEAATRHYDHVVDDCLHAIAALPRPIVAAISGPCMGGGFGLATACDFRIADRSAAFSIPAARMGIVYSTVECEALLGIVGLTNAKEILLTGRRFDAATAERYGFVREVVESDPLVAARAFAREFAASAPLAVAGMKLVLNALAAGTARERAGDIDAAVNRARLSADYREAVAAFREKRPPRFTGA